MPIATRISAFEVYAKKYLFEGDIISQAGYQLSTSQAEVLVGGYGCGCVAIVTGGEQGAGCGTDLASQSAESRITSTLTLGPIGMEQLTGYDLEDPGL